MHLCRQNITENEKYMLQWKIILIVLKEIKEKQPKDVVGVEENRVIIANTYGTFQAVYTH